jgi:hypothetical protein
MGYGILLKNLKGMTYVNRAECSSYYDLQDKMSECLKNIDKFREKLKTLAMATPKDVFPATEENGSTFFQMGREVDDIFELLEDEYNELIKYKIIDNVIDDYMYVPDSSEKIDPKTPEGWKKIIISDEITTL